MATLKELLEEIEIDVSDLEDKGDGEGEEKVDLKDVKLEDIPEEQRPLFQTLLKTVEDQTNSIAKQNLVITTLKTAVPKEEKVEKVEKDDLGLDENEPSTAVLKTILSEIKGIKDGKVADKESNWERNVAVFATKNKDIVRYAPDMDKLRNELVEDSPLKYNVAALYKLAKSIREGRETKKETKEDNLNRQDNVKRYRTEDSGFPSQSVDNISGNSKTIEEAFTEMEKQAAK